MLGPSEIASINSEQHKVFQYADRVHILMLTTHGVHEWQVIPGLPDTGGQNVFVNHFAQALAEQGYKVTIANRGGYPHPRIDKKQHGLHYKDENQRLIYLEDGLDRFVHKEDMGEQIPGLVRSLDTFIREDGTPIDLIISHYWDAAVVGERYRQHIGENIPHIWVPHSLGAIKKRNVSSEEWEGLRIDARIAEERLLARNLEDITATSPIIRDSLLKDYAYSGPMPFLPPCVDPDRYHPREVIDGDEVWEFLAERSNISPEEIQESKIIMEISRTDRTKRKDILIRAFAHVQQEIPESFLIVSIDRGHQELAGELFQLLDDLGVRDRTATLGSVWDILPKLYALTDVYCTPSVMEGFGMSAQEAAATGVPAVTSHLVPFATEYLLGETGEGLAPERLGDHGVIGEGAIVVQADDVDGFAAALKILLKDEDMRLEMGKRAYQITIPYFTWKSRTRTFLKEIGMTSSGGE